MVTGTLVHALAQAAAEGANERELRAQLDQAWKSVDAGAPWYSRREQQRVHAMLDTFLAWLTGSRSHLTQVAIEHEVTVDLPAEEDGPPIRLFLVDGSAYLFRAYHALPPLTRKSDGLPVGAVQGFCNMLWKLMRDMQGDAPTHLAWAGRPLSHSASSFVSGTDGASAIRAITSRPVLRFASPM